jgi:DNA-binding transcriptional LysR family regulator
MFESTIHRLRVFLSVVDSGSFSRASRKLNITQPSISAHIKALEQEIGKKLFVRSPGKKAKLSEAGEILFTYALDVTSKTDQLVANIKKMHGKEQSVTVAAQRNIANHLLPIHLALFSRTHPKFEIIMYSQTQDTVINQVREGKADLGLIMTLGPVEDLYSEILTFENLELVVGPTHELANKKKIDPKELENYSFVGALKTSNHAKMIDLGLKKLGINQYRMDLQVEDSKTMIEIVKRGIGIATIPAFGISEELENGELISLPLNCEKVPIEIRLVYNSKIKMTDEARLFMVFLRREISN